MPVAELLQFSHQRVINAQRIVRERFINAAATLDASGICHAVIGGNASATWIATVDESAVRVEPLVEILIRREDLEEATRALENANLAVGTGRNDIHLFFAGEKVGAYDLLPMPGVEAAVRIDGKSVLGLEALATFCLLRHKTVDRVYLRDLMDVGLIDETWPGRYPAELGARLQALLDDPNG